MGSGIKPGESSCHGLYLQLLILQELQVHRCDFQLTTSRRLDMLGYFYHLVRIEVQAYHSIVTLWMLRLLLDAQTNLPLVLERTFKILQYLMFRILFRKISVFRRNAPINPKRFIQD